MPLFFDNSWSEYLKFIYSTLVLLGFVFLGELLHHFLHVKAEHTRRLIHFATGCFVASTPFIFKYSNWIYVLASVFTIANLYAVQRSWFKGMHQIERKSIGTATFPLALLTALYLVWTINIEHQFALQIAFLILAMADPLASWVGTSMKNPHQYVLDGQIKTWAGSLTFALVTFVISVVGLAYLSSWNESTIWLTALILAIVVTMVEALGKNGWDNFFIVIASMTILVFVETHPERIWWLLCTLFLGISFALIAFKIGFLNHSGALAVALLATSVLGITSHAGWAISGMTFFLLSSLLSKWGKKRKAQIEDRNDKTSRRDAGQVYANGGISWIFLILYVFFPHDALFWGFVGAFAAAAADTWATEIGGYFQGKTWLVTNFSRAEPGVSGGISWQGTLGGTLGAVTVWCAGAYWFAPYFAQSAFVIIGSAVGAMFLDSILGATMQVLYQTPDGKTTEKKTDENGKPYPKVRGFAWMDNDIVNLLATILGGLIPLLLSQ